MSQRRQPTDVYEASEMVAPGAVLHRDKNVARVAVLAMAPMALIALLTTIMVAMGAEPAAPPVVAILPFLWFAVTLWMMLTKGSVRTVLTTDSLHVHWGFSGPKVALSSITHCAVVPPMTAGLPTATFAMNAWGPKGWVLLKWRDESGKERASQFPAADPPKLVDEINRARSQRVEVATSLRVAAEEAAVAEALEAEEAARDVASR